MAPPEGEASDHRAEGFQLGAALDPSPEPGAPAIAQNVNVHADAFAFWAPRPDAPKVELSYAGKTPNYGWPTGFESLEANMATVGGGIGIGYSITTV